MKESPYLASEDSALLRSALGGFSGGSCVEIGAGNGGNLISLRKRFGLVVGTDLVRPAMSDWRGVGVEFVVADRASCFRPATFDLVAFNPPYLPEEEEDRATDGGAGLEVPLAFLADALRVVGPRGTVVWLLNDQGSLGPFRRLCERAGLDVSELASRRLFYESLTVYRASRAPERGAALPSES